MTIQPVLEDLFLGPLATPSLSQEVPFRWEDSQRRVRVIFAGLTIADSTRVMRLQEYGRLPVYYFPLSDVRQEVLEATDHHTHSPLKGKASYWTIRVGDRVVENAAWSYPSPAGPPRVAPTKARHPTGLPWLGRASSQISCGVTVTRCPPVRQLRDSSVSSTNASMPST